MRLIHHSFALPADNLAYDEVLLSRCEEEEAEECLRLWESPSYFVVLGVSQRLAEHVQEDNCLDDGVAILRRCSAGGCVLQGPGCLNFSLVLRQDRDPELKTIRRSYCHILGRVREALEPLGIHAVHEGISDLAVDGIKLSGNAQKRRKHCLLHHGTLLYGMDMAKIGRYLQEPADRPEYRGSRRHDSFVGNVDADPDRLRNALAAAFDAHSAPTSPDSTELASVQCLSDEKYNDPTWIRRR